MPRRWILIAALLCPACATGSGPLPPDDGKTIPKSGSPGEPVVDPTVPPDVQPDPGGTSDPGTPSNTTPGGTSGSGTPSSSPPGSGANSGGHSDPGGSNPSGTPSSGPPSPPSASVPPDLDCQALWSAVDNLGCTILKLVCNVLEDVQVSGAQVPCDIVVPLACGIGSAAADAAAALCPR